MQWVSEMNHTSNFNSFCIKNCLKTLLVLKQFISILFYYSGLASYLYLLVSLLSCDIQDSFNYFVNCLLVAISNIMTILTLKCLFRSICLFFQCGIFFISRLLWYSMAIDVTEKKILILSLLDKNPSLNIN